MFSIYDGRNSFWQWDSGQRIVVSDDVCCEVHFCNGTSECAMVCEVYTEDGHRLVNVPNILLQASKPIRVFAYAETDGDNRTIHSTTFAVLARTKPADYVYTETEVLSYQALEERVTALEENGGGSPSGTLHLFHKPNGINDYATEIEVSAGKPTDLNDDGRDPQSGVVEFFETHHDGPVILRHLKDGEYDNDAATVGQLKEIDLTIPQEFTKAQKAQARDNIGAIRQGETLFLDGNDIDQVATITFENGTSLYSHTLSTAQDVLLLSNKDFTQKVILRNIADGVQKDDAATVGQLNTAVENCLKKEDTHISVDTIRASSMSISDSTTDMGTAIYALPYTDDGYAHIAMAGVVADELTRLSGVAPAFGETDAINKAQFDEAVGNIETALDGIIALQEEMIGGDAV